MSSSSSSSRQPVERVPTGIPGLDEILHGGLIPESSYLLVGSAGTGKTILSMQWLREAARRGERALYITLAEPGGKIEANVRSFGWDLGGIDLIDLTPRFEEGSPQTEYRVFPPSEVERTSLWQAIYDAVPKRGPARVVIDSVTQLLYLSADDYQFRKQLLALVTYLNRGGCTSMLVFEPTELERGTAVALAVDGILTLRREVSPSRVVGLRSVEVDKMRGSDFLSGRHPMRITSDAIRVFPHRIEKQGSLRPGAEMLPTGIAELDQLLGGGLESGTTTIVTGPTGVGKSTLGAQFLTSVVAAGKRAVLYTFEESSVAVIARCDGVGIPAGEAVRGGGLKIEMINPMELYPDEFLGMVRADVEEGGRDVVMLDSLRGYDLAMEEFGTMVAHVSNMATYLKARGVTSLLVNEVDTITGDLRATDLSLSYVSDNIILMRYAEYSGQIIRVIGCLKKRFGNFQSELRRLKITPSGLEVSEKLEHLRGILTGTPTRD